MILYINEERPSKKIYISERQLPLLAEDVFVNGLKGKKANLAYKQRASANATKTFGNLKTGERIDTGKMDQNDSDTYVIPLKGGINSYNITSINGTSIMHYFKRKFQHQTTTIDIDVNGEKDTYELVMADSEFRSFLDMFLKKVGNVVGHAIEEMRNTQEGKDVEFRGISLYPVPSSSNFNTYMCDIIQKSNSTINGLPVQVIGSALFKKDLSNLEKDKDFVAKYKDYYNSPMYQNKENPTHMDVVDATLDRFKKMTAAQDDVLIDNYNACVNKVLTSYYFKVSAKTIAKHYKALCDAKAALRQKLGGMHIDKVFQKIKYAKGPSVDKRSHAIWDIVTPILGVNFMNSRNHENQIEIVNIKKQDFQIKNLTNDTRMGLRNYFQYQDNAESQKELERIEGTVFVIFDDNISGGATLSDICYQAKQLGIKWMVPITFGKMQMKYHSTVLRVNKPSKSGYFEN